MDVAEDIAVSIRNTNTSKYYNNGLNLPSGYYHMTVQCKVFNPYPDTSGDNALVYGPTNVTLSINNIKLVQSKLNEGKEWKPTFDIWVKNIWSTEKIKTETEQEYADRVWLPILGDEGREAMITFSSGWLSSSENWEFMVVKGGYAYDTTKSYNGVPSHWRLTLQKSDAELKATNKYIPNMGMQAVAGDMFFFTGIDMQHQYVLFAEERVNTWKFDNLAQTKDVNPTWVAKLDKVRINDGTLLIDRIRAGALVNIKDKRFIDGVLALYIQSVTYNYSDKLISDVDIVLTDKVVPVLNPVQKLQGDIDTLSVKVANQSTALLNMVRQMCDALYLRKDGITDLSKSPTSFNALVKSGDFRGGMAGGKGWGIYRDEDGNSIAEFDHVRVRESFTTNEFIRNTTKFQGGTQIYSAAEIEISRVVENENDYECYFDQKNGSIANLFAYDDVAYSQLFDSQNNTIKFYKRRVVGVGVDYLKLSKTDQYGDGIPAEKDIVIHCGNYTDKDRQYIIVRDIIGGGYDRMISNLDSVSAVGNEYYFAGRENGNSPRWFVGDSEGDYAEWQNGRMYVRGDFILRNSKQNVETVFEIQDGKIKGGIEQTQSEAIRGKSFLYNASFTKGFEGWLTSDESSMYWNNGSLLTNNNSVLTKTVTISGKPIYDNVFFATIDNGWIKQPSTFYVDKPNFEEGKKYPLVFSANVRCEKSGVLNVQIVGGAATNAKSFKGISSEDYFEEYVTIAVNNIEAHTFSLIEGAHLDKGDEFLVDLSGETPRLYNTSKGIELRYNDWREEQVTGEEEQATTPAILVYSGVVESNNDFKSIDVDNLAWSGSGDFYLSFTGKADFYGLTIYTDKTEVRNRTFFDMSDRLISFGAQQLNADGTISKESGIVVQPEGAGLYAKDKNGNQSRIAAYSDGKVVLEGSEIQLKGNLTADGKFKVREDGSIEATNGAFNGYLINKPIRVTEYNYRDFFTGYHNADDYKQGWSWRGWVLCSCVILKYTSAMYNNSNLYTVLTLPSVDVNTVNITEDELNTIRAFIGQSITI